MKKREYQNFVDFLEELSKSMIEKYENDIKKNKDIHRPFLEGWNNAGISIFKSIIEDIEELKKGRYNY